MSDLSQRVRLPVQSVPWSAGVLIALLILAGASSYRGRAEGAQGDEEQKRDLAKTEAVILWTGLAIVSVLVLGIGLIWGVTRAAKRILKKHEPVHTEMPNIWYLNPPERRKQDEP